MTAHAVPTIATARRTPAEPEPTDDLLDVADPVVAAAAYVAEAAFTASEAGRVGLELELHLVRLEQPERRPSWPEVQELVAGLPAMPHASTVTLEPGGQIELSTPPGDDVVAAVEALRADRRVLAEGLAAQGYGAAPLGADPAREPRRVNPHPRYAAMEAHFDARSCGPAGRDMMTGTAALQINLDAGPAAGWAGRIGLLRSMVPMLVAASSTSPYLGGRSSGWHSMRQQTWTGIDHSRSDPVAGAEPAVGWALYALDAPVMLVPDAVDPTAMRPVTSRVTFAEWLRRPDLLGRRATLADLDYHLTTLFPPVRPRGYVELRCVDSLPDRWWPAVAAIVATIADDAVAADRAAELCEGTAHAWEAAARVGLGDPAIHAAVAGCVEVAAARAPAPLRSEVEAFAEIVTDRGGPAGELRAIADARGPLQLLEEEARA